jgi:SAM-dependent methyltransferase
MADAHNALTAGHAALARGEVNQALKSFITALRAAPADAQCRRAVIDTLGLLDGYALPPDVVSALSAAAHDPAIDPTPLPRIARNILAKDARWTALLDGPLSEHAWFYDSPLLLAALERATVIDETLEHALTRVRRRFIFDVVRNETSVLLERHERFVAALARQCAATRHVWIEQSDERAALARIGKAGHKHFALLRCLYEPLEELTEAQRETLPSLLAGTFNERAEERTLASALPQLTAIAPGLSRDMQAQYERFPYPLWRDTALNSAMTWPEMIARFVGTPAFPTPQPAAPDVLIAGCGTGRSTAMMATLLPAARILAVDLSRASLGYATRKARELKLNNVGFGVADILNLAQLNRRFDLIECGGVLHHMAEHKKGLQVLSELLLPGGLLNLALYSERARGPIVAARSFVAEHKFPDDIAGLRAFRAAVFALPADHLVRRITRRPDFYSADNLHDLVFNAYEARFTPATLKALIAGAGLTFLGFNVARADRLAAYRAAHPHDAAGRDLDAWEDFDKSYPDTFQGMFSMWLQKPP